MWEVGTRGGKELYRGGDAGHEGKQFSDGQGHTVVLGYDEHNLQYTVAPIICGGSHGAAKRMSVLAFDHQYGYNAVRIAAVELDCLVHMGATQGNDPALRDADSQWAVVTEWCPSNAMQDQDASGIPQGSLALTIHLTSLNPRCPSPTLMG